MNRLLLATLLVYTLFNLIQSLPVFDAELAASPLIHEVRINYRGGRKSVYSGSEQEAAAMMKKKK
jgi:hypothetical protein